MKITKKIEAEILQVMDEYWGSYLNGDLPTWASFLPDDYRNIGTTKAEIWNSKKEIVDFTERVLDQTVGMAETRNKKTQIIPYDPYLMVHELGDLYVKAEEGWVFYAPFRLSSLLEKTANGWKILHQHGSYPDSKADDGEAFAFSELKIENKKLRDAIQARTIELERKNRELEIEAALERVRARTMAMHQSDELRATSLLLFDELKALGEISEQISIGIFDEENQILNLYSTLHGEQWKEASKVDLDEPLVMQKIYSGWKQNKKSIQVDLSGAELKAYNRFRSQYSNLKFPDKRWVIHCAFFSKGVFSFSTTTPHGEQTMHLLERFAQVFDGTYTRFLDLQKAEEQAREAQIEVTLERIRSRSMSMHNSDELVEVAMMLNTELRSLGFPVLFESGFIHMHEESNLIKGWMCNFEGNRMDPFKLPLTGDPVMDERFKSWKNQKKLLHQTIGGKQLFDHVQFCMPTVKSKDVLAQVEKHFSDPTHFYHSYFPQGAISIITQSALSKEQESLIIRFTGVFKQTYTRFLDLQKAEAQAREAKIEAALERVRSKSMAMHHTSELQDVINIVGQQFTGLNIENSGGVFITINDEIEDKIIVWGSGETASYVQKVQLPYYDRPIYTEIVAEVKKGPKFYTEEFSCAEKIEFFKHLFNHPPYNKTSQSHQKKILSKKGNYTRSCSINKHTTIFMVSHDGHTFTQDENDILIRFGKVFEQTYTRFLDLQKAEAQAQEAKIEAALERVRSRTMAMHQSDEMKEIVGVLYQQIESLNLGDWGCNIQIFNEEEACIEIWLAEATQQISPRKYLFPGLDHPDIRLQWEAWKNKKSVFHLVLEGDRKINYDDYVLEHTDFKLFPTEVKAHIRSMEKACFSFAYMQYGFIVAISSASLLSEESMVILQRFAKVFEQAYTRFLDLQKAEAQAREAQIEAALERVRAQTMAMHNSEDVGKCTVKMFSEVTALGVDEGTRFGIGILNHNNENNQLWTASKDGEEVKMHIGHIEMTWHPLLKSARKAWKEQLPLHTYILEGEDLRNYYQMLNDAPDYKYQTVIEKLPEREFHYGFVFDHGFFYAFSPHEFSPELIRIVQRFSSLFGQTYRRYLDLVKAEAQAREAQIETALERVRSRSMAMHKSAEIQEVANTAFENLLNLGVAADTVTILTPVKGTKDFEVWIQNTNHNYSTQVLMPYQDHLISKDIFEAWQNKLELWTASYDKKQKDSFFKFFFSYSKSLKDLPQDRKQYVLNGDNYSLSVSFNTHTGMQLGRYYGEAFSKVDNSILQRFSKVFEQTYTRFLDLQKAEKQAREAQIEAALERVRSRSLAMHKTDELGEVITVIFEKLKDLNFSVDEGIALITFTEGSQDMKEWMYNPGFKSAMNFHLPYFDHPVLSNFWEAKNKGENYMVKRYSLEESQSFHNHIFNHTDYKHTPNEVKAACLSAETYSTSIAIQKNTAIFINDYSGIVLSENEIDILKRFSRVFEQTYIRFLDLQKAETQAREAQIDLSLERIRAKATAMKKSEDLLDIVVKMRTEFVSLGQDAHYFWHMKWAPEKYFKAMTSGDGTRIGMVMQLPRKIHGEIPSLAAWEKSDAPTTVHVMDVEATLDYVHKMVEWGDFQRIDPNMPTEDDIRHIGGLTYVMARTMHGEIGYSLPGMVPDPPEEAIKILQRFADTFDLAYRRFEDLQKAEKQAREAQIEAALERTRSQSMMMQHSNELNTTSNVFHEQLLLLGLPSEFSYVWLPDEANGTHMFWATWSENQNGAVTSRSKAYTYPLDKTEPYTAACFEMWESDKDVFVNSIQPEEVEAFFSTWSELVGEAEQLKAKNFPDGLYYAEAYMKYGCFGINIRRPLDEAEQDVLRRFANEFERTYTRFLDLQKAEEQARKIKQVNKENERLLHSILPQPIAEQIRMGQQTVVKRFEQVSILFADIVGFTILSEKASPSEVVDILNGLFSKFDDLTDQFGLEKIKTIGDAYMVAAGVPEEKEDHAQVMFHFAKSMLQTLQEYNQANGSDLNLRIGISSGPVIAGVIGKKKFAYDLWGDSVNTAARMEAYGQAGKIQVSPNSYELLKNEFSFEKIPDVPIKGKGVMDVYLWKS